MIFWTIVVGVFCERLIVTNINGILNNKVVRFNNVYFSGLVVLSNSLRQDFRPRNYGFVLLLTKLDNFRNKRWGYNKSIFEIRLVNLVVLV